MAGHNKWSQIKRKKAVTDQRRAAQWSKIIREITVSAKLGGGDPEANPRLRLAVDDARSANMPNDNIDRAIRKGTGELEGVDYEELTYEGYGPNGVAIFIQTLTDNANRTVADLRHILAKHGGNLGQSGSVAWMFDQRGQIVFDAGRHDEAALMEAAIDAGALDLQSEDGEVVVLTEVVDFHTVQEGLREAGFAWESAELAMIPRSMMAVSGREAERLLALLERIEESDDVQQVYTNADIDEQTLAAAGS